MCMVVEPVGFTGGEPLPARTTARYSDLFGAAVSSQEIDEKRTGDPAGAADQPVTAEVAMMDRFLSDYLDLMDGRIATIRDYVDRLRYEEARVAILSLESASGMLGESELRALLHDLRVCVDSCPIERKNELLDAIQATGAQVRARLSTS